MKPHKNLDAWKKSFLFVKEIYIVTKNFPPDERFGMTSQMRRASLSIPLNIAEGAARKTKKQFIFFLRVALGSMSELDTTIMLAKELEYITEAKEKELIDKLDLIGKLIYGLIKKLESDLSKE
jgi:four helix bundle protein